LSESVCFRLEWTIFSRPRSCLNLTRFCLYTARSVGRTEGLPELVVAVAAGKGFSRPRTPRKRVARIPALGNLDEAIARAAYQRRIDEVRATIPGAAAIGVQDLSSTGM
jgi:hypothetical protein